MTAVAAATMVAQDFPAATPVGPVVFNLLDANGTVADTQSVTAAAADLSATATFQVVAPGTYTISAERQDGAGKALVPAVVSSSFTIAAPATVSISVPSGVAVTAT